MFESLIEMFNYPFIVNAIIVGGLVALCAALLGVSLVLKRYSMIGDGLSHVGFGALSVAMVLNLAPLTLAVPVVLIAAFLMLRISQSSKINSDSLIALIATTSLAVGVFTTSVSGGLNADVNSYMFGSIFAISDGDVTVSVILSLAVLTMFILFYNKIFAITFDENFARATGTKAGVYNMLLAALVAITIVIGMRIMGTMLISGLIVFPALSSMRVCRSFKSVVVLSCIISVVCFVIGICVSYLLGAPAGASIIIVNAFVFLFMIGIQKIKSN